MKVGFFLLNLVKNKEFLRKVNVRFTCWNAYSVVVFQHLDWKQSQLKACTHWHPSMLAEPLWRPAVVTVTWQISHTLDSHAQLSYLWVHNFPRAEQSRAQTQSGVSAESSSGNQGSLFLLTNLCQHQQSRTWFAGRCYQTDIAGRTGKPFGCSRSEFWRRAWVP